ncbi:MAG TPA: hemolysin family protein [Oligoflexia bacterium]|nr:hemolysin family protein [Oligoflexia bacterium]HMP47876.1 hemolysin family protein [Oligoflexia bacterium]
MDPDPASSFYHIISIGSLILLNGLFVASEYALISYDPAKLRNLSGKDQEKELEKKNRSILWLLNNSELCVASIQFGITACSLLIGFLGIQLFNSLLVSSELTGSSSWIINGQLTVDTPLVNYIIGMLPFLVSFLGYLIFLTLLHVIFGELFVKAIGTAYPDTTLRFLAGPMKLFTQVSYPVSLIAYRVANIFLKPFQLSVAHNDNAVLSLAELKRLFSSVPSATEINEAEINEIKVDQARMLRGVVGFSETIAREVMTPRTDLVTIKVDSSFEDVIKIILDSGFSRYLVRGERVDDVVGILLARDVLPYLASNNSSGEKRESFNLKKIMRKPYFIPGTKAIDDLLNEFKRRNQHIAVILDEHGGVDGIVTMEDLIEEIVGDIYDEGDEPERDFIREPGGDLIVDGGVLVADLNEKFGLEIPEGEYDTVAGFIFTYLGRIPRSSDRIFISTDEHAIYVNDRLERVNGSSQVTGTSPQLSVPPAINNPEDQNLPEQKNGILVSVEQVRGHRIESVRFSFTDETEKTSNLTVSPEAEFNPEASELKSALAR